MPIVRWRCPECGVVLKTAGVPAGRSIRCPKCRAVVKTPADEDLDLEEVEEVEEAPRLAARLEVIADGRQRNTGKWVQHQGKPLTGARVQTGRGGR